LTVLISLHERDGFSHDSIRLCGHVHKRGNTGYVEQFRQFGKRAVNAGADVRKFHPISIAELITLADG
jgi:calcineurin-like phosphoesterase family protein